MQHKRQGTANVSKECDEGGRTLLCCNEGGLRSPSLDFLDTSSDEVPEDMILDYLASIISDMYLRKHYASSDTETGSDILPGFNQRTG